MTDVALQPAFLRVMDATFGWLLAMPRDAGLLVFSAFTALLLVAVRRFTTNQDLLRRCAADKRQLKTLIREAKQAKDKEALQRHRAVRSRVALKQLGAEWRPLLLSLLPVAALTTWAWQRMEFHPPRAGEPIEFTLSFPTSMTGKFVHLVPKDGLRSDSGWIRELRVERGAQSTRVAATWLLRAEVRSRPHDLLTRVGDKTYAHPLLVGQRHYVAPLLWHDGQFARSEVKLRPVRLFGFLPGVPVPRVPAWLIGYLVLTLCFASLFKRGWKVA